MFTKIRNRMTILYSAIMVIFLLSFMFVSYTGVSWVLYLEEQRDVQALAEEEARKYTAILSQTEVLSIFSQPESRQANAESNNGKEIFYYVFDAQGKQLLQVEPAGELQSYALDTIQNWQDEDGIASLKQFRLANGERAVVMMCSKEMVQGNRLLGTVFVGEDLTNYYQMLERLLMALVGAAVIFCLIAAFLGHLLAGRAIIPIKQSFIRQREFTADASHELRTPLSVLMTSIDVLQADDDSRLSSFSHQVLSDMRSEVKRMSKLVSDLLILARADAGVTTMNREKFSLYDVTEQALRLLQPVALEKAVKLSIDGNNNISVYADKERIKQLLLILVDNAIKYSAAGGRVIVLIELAHDLKQAASITVKDNGVGIAKDDQQLIFERFYRVDKVRSREQGGSGLGLAIANQIIASHGGSIKLASTPGVGSSFIITLPMQ
ncbi:MAG: ATP-binding protein [Sporomusa sp.]